jgi:hypothetical protein
MSLGRFKKRNGYVDWFDEGPAPKNRRAVLYTTFAEFNHRVLLTINVPDQDKGDLPIWKRKPLLDLATLDGCAKVKAKASGKTHFVTFLKRPYEYVLGKELKQKIGQLLLASRNDSRKDGAWKRWADSKEGRSYYMDLATFKRLTDL